MADTDLRKSQKKRCFFQSFPSHGDLLNQSTKFTSAACVVSHINLITHVHSANVYIIRLCSLQLLPSIVVPQRQQHNARTARDSTALWPRVETRGRSRDPWFSFWTQNHKQEVTASQSHSATSSLCLQ